jgi:hypothetical protein
LSCLFCDNNSDFNTVEHIIPESLGNDDLLLRKEICDKCQRYLSENEKYILSHTPIGFWRTLLTIKTKKGNLPQVDFTKSSVPKGKIPDVHPLHDNFGFEAHEDFTTELKLPHSVFDKTNSEGQGRLQYVITPKVMYEIGRFLGKIGLELICLSDSEQARQTQFDLIRNYVRKGSLKEIWPVFHSSVGNIKDLFTYKHEDDLIKEDVTCYSYALKQIDTYIVFNLTIGTDSWLICLNDMFPTPVIRSGFPELDIQLMWYSKKEWQ